MKLICLIHLQKNLFIVFDPIFVPIITMKICGKVYIRSFLLHIRRRRHVSLIMRNSSWSSSSKGRHEVMALNHAVVIAHLSNWIIYNLINYFVKNLILMILIMIIIETYSCMSWLMSVYLHFCFASFSFSC